MFQRPNQYGFQLPTGPSSQPMQRGAGGVGMPMGNPLMGQQNKPTNPLTDPAAMQAIKAMLPGQQQGGNPLNGAPPQLDEVARANMDQEQPGSAFQGVLNGLQAQPDWMTRNLGMNFGSLSGLFG